jgi:8-oxo-dGTP diphosphatase
MYYIMSEIDDSGLDFQSREANMSLKQRTRRFLEYAENNYLPNVEVRTVIFSFRGNSLNVFLLNHDNTDLYALPGGPIKNDEDVDMAAARNLSEITSMKDIFLEQFHTFGKCSEGKNVSVIHMLENNYGGPLPENNYYSKRKVIVCYYSLVDETKVNARNNLLMVSGYRWANINTLPKLIGNENGFIDKALQSLRDDMDKQTIARHLMNPTFTMNELQRLYELVYQHEFTRSNFQRHMLNLDILERLEKQYDGGAHKAPFLYKFKDT